MQQNSSSQLSVRDMTTEDLPSGLRLCRASAWNQVHDDWLIFLNSPRSAARLAELDGEPIATAAFLRYGPFTWISMMLVDPAQRGMGVGSHLFKDILSLLENDRCVRLDATPAGEALYRRHGFEIEYGLARMTTKVVSHKLPSDFGMTRLMEETDLPDVCRKDFEVFGADRSNLLLSLYRRAPSCAWVFKRSATIHGYLFGRRGHLYHQLGPIVAEDDAVAQQLISNCLSAQHGNSFAIDTPKLTSGWVSWLESTGFVKERPFVRMRRGECKNFGLLAYQYGIAGPEFG